MQRSAGYRGDPHEMDHPVLRAEQRQQDQDRDQQGRIFAEIPVAADALHQLPVITVAEADLLFAPDKDDADRQHEAQQDQQGDIGRGNADFTAFADFHQGFHRVPALPWFRIDLIKET